MKSKSFAKSLNALLQVIFWLLILSVFCWGDFFTAVILTAASLSVTALVLLFIGIFKKWK